MNVISTETLVRQLLELGVTPGGVLLVHISFSKARPVECGPKGLIQALQAALGQQGTLVMPSMSYDDDHPFDKRTSPCSEMGVVADTFWKLPGVMRSDNNHAFAAIGPLAEAILAPHPINVPHCLNSLVGRVYELDGQILLLGVRQFSNTTTHLAENLAGVRYR
jgi:aminoglycoside 3-N-acetyltransferase